MPLIERGRTIGREFVIGQQIGSGGMGAVFVALQKSTGVRRALKLMRPEIVRDPRLRERFVQEARVSGSIPSDHVVQVITAGIDEETSIPFLVMELLEGEELSTAVRERGPFDAGSLATVFEQLCHAVGAAHRTGIVHRDLKPENVFLARSRIVGAPFVVKVLDFGIAKIVAEARVHTTEPMGTPLWMAPEQTARGSSVSPQTDVWALGLIAFFCLTGHTYWASAEDEHPSVEQILREMLVDDLVRPSKRAGDIGLALPSWFDAWFGRCVQRDPKARFSDAAQVWDELARCIRDALAAAGTERMLGSPVHETAAPGVPATLSFEVERPGVRLAPTIDAGRAAPIPQLSSPSHAGSTPVAAVSDRDRPDRRPLTWLLGAIALALGGLALRWMLAQGTSGTASRTNDPESGPVVKAIPTSVADADIVASKVKAWNAAHAAIDGSVFASLYADSVLYYGSQQSADACVKGKRAFLTKNDDFRQEIAAEIRTELHGDDMRADFLKRVSLHGKVTDYPSYLVFRRFGTGWRIVTEGDTVTDANLAKKAAKATAAQGAVMGDFDGDGTRESLRVIPPRLPDKQTEENFGDCIGACECRLEFSNPRLPPIIVESCISGHPVNEGDLDDDGADEIGLLPGWWTSCWRGYMVYTLKNGNWRLLLDPISTHCNQWDQGVDAIAKDPSRPGYVTTHYTDMSGTDLSVKTKSVKVR